MAALFDRVQMTLNKRGSATMKPISFCDEFMMRLASQAFEHSLCLSPEKPTLPHNVAQGARTHGFVIKKPATPCQVSQEIGFTHKTLKTRPRDSRTPLMKIRMEISTWSLGKPMRTETKISH
jgi:hypothetical protein